MIGIATITSAGSSIFCNVISSVIFEVGKFVVDSRNSQELSLDKIEAYVLKKADKKIFERLESKIVCEFLQAPQTLDTICNIVEISILEKIYTFKVQNRKIKEYELYLSETQEYLVTEIINKINRESIVKPDKKEFKELFQIIFDTASDYIVQFIDINTKVNIVARKYDNDRLQNILSINTDKIIEQMKNMRNFTIEKNLFEFDKIKNKYHMSLISKYSTAHIYLLNTFEFKSFYVPPFLEIEQEIKSADGNETKLIKRRIQNYPQYKKINPFNDWMYIFDKSNIIYVTGGAGYGKTLFMKKIINDYKDLHILYPEEYLIIYGEIKMFYSNNRDVPLSMTEFLLLCIKNSTLRGEDEIPVEFIQHYLNQGRCIILLDALDEVEKSKRSEIHDNIISYFKNENPNNKICITSRSRGFFPKKDIKSFNIMALGKRQIETYVNNIIKLGEFESKDKESFMNQANTLVNKGFLNSFLVLSLLINIYKAERELPENKLDLYQKCFEYIATRREKEKSSGKYNWEDIGLLMKDNTFMELANLCYPNNTDVGKAEIKSELIKIYTPKFGNEAKAENVIEEFLNFCSDRTELFVPSLEEHYKFFHRSFFEYFYSQYIFIRYHSAQEIYSKIVGFDIDSEIFELIVATLKQKAEYLYQDLIEYMFDKVCKEINDVDCVYTAFNVLTLSMSVVDDKLYRDRYVNLLISHKEKFLNNYSFICNEVIADFILQDAAYSNKLNIIYYNENMLNMLIYLKSTLKDINEEDNIFGKQIYFTQRALPSQFNLKIFIRTTEVVKEFSILKNKDLEKIRIESNASKKEWYGVKSAFREYKALEPKYQQQIFNNMSFTDFWNVFI